MRSASAWSAKPAPRTSQKPLDSSGDESVIHFRLEVICDPKPYSLDLRERVVSYVEGGHSRRAAAAHFRVSPSFVINLMTAFRERGAVAPKALGGWRHSKLDPHRVFILRRVAEKDDISMPELAGELQAASGVKADPASLSRWLIRNGLSFKKKPSGQRMRSARRAQGARGVEG